MSSDHVMLRDIAIIIRSKNSGPFKITFDIMMPDRESYDRMKRSDALTADKVLDALGISPNRLVVHEWYDAACAVKTTVRREIPSGSLGDTDVYGCQQAVALEYLLVHIA